MYCLNTRPTIVKLLLENIEDPFHNNRISEDFFWIRFTSTKNKTTVDKWDFIKLKKKWQRKNQQN